MHPIVMIASDKDPAIGKAVEDLEAAGFEVRVLNSAKAKLVDFLGAIAGVDDSEVPEDDEFEEPRKPKAPKKDEVPDDDADADAEALKALGNLDGEGGDEEEPAAPIEEPIEDESAELPAEDAVDADDPLDPSKMEALISGEKVNIEIIDGSDLLLHPSTIQAGAKTFYSLNESKFSFWPDAVSNEPITGGVELSFNGEEVAHLSKVTFSEEAKNPPVLKIGREWLKENRLRGSWSILPASQVLYGKGKVTVEDVRGEMGDKGIILVCKRTVGSGRFGASPKEQFPVFLTSYGTIAKIGMKHEAHHDQTMRELGTFEVVGIITLGKDAKGDKIEGMSGADVYKLKAPVSVFK